MNRHAFVYLFISLTMVSLLFASLPHAAAETSRVPAGITETFTPVPATETPVPTETPAPTNVPEHTYPTNTPALTNTPVPTPASTATVPAVIGLPNTGGAATQGGASPWILVLVIGSLGALAAGLSIRALHPTRR